MHWRAIRKQYIEGRLSRAILRKNFAVVETYLNRKERVTGLFRVAGLPDSSIPTDVCAIQFSANQIDIRLGAPEVFASQMLADRLPELSTLFVLCQRGGAIGNVLFSLGDSDQISSVAFCSNFPDSLLIPDFEYLRNRAYRNHDQVVRNHAGEWSQRKPMAVWRGITTGTFAGSDWRSLPRVQLCEIASRRDDLFDVGLTRVTQFAGSDLARQELYRKKLMRPFMEAENWVKYKYQIDIDGQSNAWSGLFKKLMTGSPVLKVASPSHFRQWYYDRLVPFVNFIPVRSDMSDLIENLLWLHANDTAAQAIGRAGRELALSLDYENELAKARDAIIARA